MGNRVDKSVWVGNDRCATLGDLALWLQQIVDRYGADKPISGVTLGRGHVVRPFPLVGEVWRPDNHASAPRSCDAVYFMTPHKGRVGHFPLPLDKED